METLAETGVGRLGDQLQRYVAVLSTLDDFGRLDDNSVDWLHNASMAWQECYLSGESMPPGIVGDRNSFLIPSVIKSDVLKSEERPGCVDDARRSTVPSY